MTAAPPLPPQVQSQMNPAAMFADMGRVGGALPDPINIAEQKLAELEQLVGSISSILEQIQPALTALLVPIAKAGQALQAEVAGMKERAGAPTSIVQGSAPPAVPGIIPGARPAV